MLDGLGASGGQQPDHLRHRVKNRTTGPDSGEPILYCALRDQLANVAQGRVLLSPAARRCNCWEQRLHQLRRWSSSMSSIKAISLTNGQNVACSGLTSSSDLTVPQGLEMWGLEMNAVAPAQVVEIFQHQY